MDTATIEKVSFLPRITYRIENGTTNPAYIRLFDDGWEKEGVLIDVPAMDDPTIGHPQPIHSAAYFTGKGLVLQDIYIWCPYLRTQLDLFTLHFYESGEDPDVFEKLQVISPRYDPYQSIQDVIIISLEKEILLTERTRVAFIMPAVIKAVIDFHVAEAQPMT